MKDDASLPLHLTSFGGCIQHLIEEQWNFYTNFYTNFFTSLSKSSPGYLERSRQHFHSSNLLTDPVFLLPAELSANVFSTFSPSTHILGSEIGRTESSQFLFCSLSPLSPLLPCFDAEEEDTQLCWASCPVLSGNLEFTHSGSTVSSAFYMELDGHGRVPL